MEPLPSSPSWSVTPPRSYRKAHSPLFSETYISLFLPVRPLDFQTVQTSPHPLNLCIPQFRYLPLLFDTFLGFPTLVHDVSATFNPVTGHPFPFLLICLRPVPGFKGPCITVDDGPISSAWNFPPLFLSTFSGPPVGFRLPTRLFVVPDFFFQTTSPVAPSP